MVSDETIRRLSREAAEGSKWDWAREAARVTGGVPVYSDMGGVLVVFGDGRVVLVDSDTGTVRPVEDKGWRLVALAKAAKRFQELTSLMPQRPPGAATCPACGGSGVVLSNVICGSCHSLGWVEP